MTVKIVPIEFCNWIATVRLSNIEHCIDFNAELIMKPICGVALNLFAMRKLVGQTFVREFFKIPSTPVD